MNPNAEDPIHATTLEPRSASRAPTSTPPTLSSESRVTMGLCMMAPGMRCASLTIKVTEDPPTTMSTRRTIASTRPAAAFPGARRASQSCSGWSATYRTGMPINPVAYGASAIASAPVSATTSAAAARRRESERVVNPNPPNRGRWLSQSLSQPFQQPRDHRFLLLQALAEVVSIGVRDLHAQVRQVGLQCLRERLPFLVRQAELRHVCSYGRTSERSLNAPMSSATPATIAKAAIRPMIAASVTGGESSANTDATTLSTPNAAAQPHCTPSLFSRTAP